MKFVIDLANEDHVKNLCEQFGVDHLVFTNFVEQLIKNHQPPEKKAV